MSSFYPANGTTLLSQDWRNGSLIDQIIFNGVSWQNLTVYPLNAQNTNLNLSIFPNKKAFLSFNSGTALRLTGLALFEALFNPDANQISIACVIH